MNTLVIAALALLAVANATPSGLLLGGWLGPRHNQWGDVGPAGVVTGAGARSAAGIVTGAGAAGPAGVVTGVGAVGPNGVSNYVRDDGLVGLGGIVGVPGLGLGLGRGLGLGLGGHW